MKIRLDISAPGSEGEITTYVSIAEYQFLCHIADVWNNKNQNASQPYIKIIEVKEKSDAISKNPS